MRARLGPWLAVAAVAVGAPGPTAGQVDTTAAVVMATTFAMPSSPAFALLGVNPASVPRPAFARDFKLDLLVQDFALAPDVALAVHPVWTFFFGDVSAVRYRDHVSPLARMLSTLAVSVGTTQDAPTSRRLAWGATLTPVRDDPLMDTAFLARVEDALDPSDEQMELAQEHAGTLIDLDMARAAVEADTSLTADQRSDSLAALAGARTAAAADYAQRAASLEDDLRGRIRGMIDERNQAEWNSTALQLGFGRVYHYENPELDRLHLRNAGYGGWVNFATGLGSRDWLVSALGKVTGGSGGMAGSSGGANIRHGGSIFNFFVEYLYRDSDDPAAPTSHEIAYGGEYRLDDGRNVEFGLRTAYDTSFHLSELRPVVKVNWKFGRYKVHDLMLGQR